MGPGILGVVPRHRRELREARLVAIIWVCRWLVRFRQGDDSWPLPDLEYCQLVEVGGVEISYIASSGIVCYRVEGILERCLVPTPRAYPLFNWLMTAESSSEVKGSDKRPSSGVCHSFVTS